MTSSVLQLSNVQFRYSSGAEDVLAVPELSVGVGQLVSILGPSGCGKSTLLRLVAGLLTPSTGQVVRSFSGSPGVVFQSANLVPWRTAKQNVLLPTELGTQRNVVPEQLVQQLFEMVGLKPEDTAKRPAELSGGMQMRVSIARSLILNPQALLLDEPFAALDDLLRMELEEEVRRIHSQRSLTTLLVTHNISEAVFMSDRVLVLGGNPSVVQADIDIALPEDRSRALRSSQQFHQLVDIVTNAMHASPVQEAGA